MTRAALLSCLFFVCSLLASCSAANGRAGSGPRVISLTRVIRILVRTLNPQETPTSGRQEPKDLIASAAAPDEPPEGPDGFDILQDGGVAITDPFRKRIAVFDSAGKFRKGWNIG